ncbi:MAG: hypothetical protein WBM28_15700 [Burkholderiales bacterium]
MCRGIRFLKRHTGEMHGHLDHPAFLWGKEHPTAGLPLPGPSIVKRWIVDCCRRNVRTLFLIDVTKQRNYTRTGYKLVDSDQTSRRFRAAVRAVVGCTADIFSGRIHQIAGKGDEEDSR